MKRFKTLILSLILLTSLCSCDIVKKDNYDTFTADNQYFLYNTNEQVYMFDVDKNGNLYYFVQRYETDNDDNIIYETVENILISLDLNGNVINETVYNQKIPDCMAVNDEGKVYFYLNDSWTGNGEVKIFSIDNESGEMFEIVSINDFTEIKKMIIIDNVIYFIGIELSATGKDYSLFDVSDDFFYYGEIIRSYDLNTGVMSDIYTELPINISGTVDGNLMIYAYDENGGYFFQKYNIDKKTLGDKIYRTFIELRDIDTEFITTENDEEIIYLNHTSINMSKLESGDSPVTTLTSDFKINAWSRMIYKSGYLFYLVDAGGLKHNIRRFKLSEFMRSPTIINMGYTLSYSFPDGHGFFINQSELSYSEFALKVLSGDNNYDFYLINSQHGFADNIRKKGAYYPLNDVPYVSEYIDKIFPYLKEAAVKENGDIWMIPTELFTASVTYNEKVWERYNININDINNLEEFIDTFYNFNKNNINESYQILPYMFARNYFYQLIEKNNGFNRDDFKKMAEFCYNKVNYIKEPTMLVNETTKTNYDSIIGGLLNSSSIDGDFRYINYGMLDLMLTAVVKCDDYDDYDKAVDEFKNGNRLSLTINNYKHLRYSALPTIEGVEKKDISCDFFYVNPNSKNLDIVLEFISEYCKERVKKRNTFVLKDKSLYDDKVYINDFYDIYSDGYVRFGLGDELFFDDLEKYLNDTIPLDEFLDRVEYKINAYLNE